MTRSQFLYLGLFLVACTQAIANSICGFWTTVNEKTKKPESIVAIYEYHDTVYGRIIGTYEKSTGNIVDTMYHPIERAPGVVGEPFYSGLDFIYNLKKSDSRYKGRIVDPEEGNVYNAELWVNNGNLIVRGKILFFGRNQTWLPFKESEFTKDFPKPDVSKFIPVIPKVIND